MKKIGTLKPGTIFNYAREKFVVLEQTGSGVFCLKAQSSRSVPFAKDGSSTPNDYGESNLREEIEDVWLQGLLDNGAKPEDLVEFEVDLRETDGSAGYGTMRALAAPLTLWQYGKYKDFIPLNEDDGWWLVTPWKTRWLRSPYTGDADYVWRVYSNGDWHDGYAGDSYGIRPALKLNSELLVSVDGEEECDNRDRYLAGVDTLVLIDELRRRYSEATVSSETAPEVQNE